MKWFTYDIEVFKYDWIVVFKHKETGEYAVFHNDGKSVNDFITDNAVYCGFNCKFYDQYVLKAICGGFSPEEVKQVNDWIIAGNQGWEHPLLNGVYSSFNNVDIRDDVQNNLSLKAIEGHLGMNIEETEVDFNLDRPLTPDELALTIKYCKHDVDATEKLTEIRKGYLQTKLTLGKRADINSVKALASTNAKLTALMLGAVKKEWYDGRDYVYPPNLDLSLIPKEVIDFFNTIHDLTIPDDVLFKTSLDIDIGGMPCKFAWGGVHGSLCCYHEEETETRVIQNRDVSSLYPSLIEGYNYLSRNVPNPQLFYDIRKDRITAKHNGDKPTANALKLPLNTVSGAQENKFNDLYDPLPTRSMRISGQLFLTMLTMQLLNKCKTIKLLNLNTDGLMYSIDKSEVHIVDEIAGAWEKQTGFELETDEISKVWLKDVNNLLMIKTNGEVKTVGGYLNYGISVKGAWAINNNATIVKKATIDYFVNGTPVETTISECDNIFQFQLIAKAGSKYKRAFHIVDGKEITTQKVNRVYATADTRYGKLYKVKTENDAVAMIESLPEHCIIDNDNHLTIDDIDKNFYIELAHKRINDFLGVEEEPKKKGKKKMATNNTKTLNVYQKLLKARTMFLQSNAKKSGKNMHLAFKYFELDDIVPIATKIFDEVGLISIASFNTEQAVMSIQNTEKADEQIVFCAPLIMLPENKGTNMVQALGSTITYYRRYLYMMALDICEPDGFDGGIPTTPTNTTSETPTTPAATKPISLEKTQPSLTNANSNASETQVTQLKAVLKELLAKDPSKEQFVQTVAINTQSFTQVSKVDCEKLITSVTAMIKEVK